MGRCGRRIQDTGNCKTGKGRQECTKNKTLGGGIEQEEGDAGRGAVVEEEKEKRNYTGTGFTSTQKF